jgi:hypothetical protein
MRERHHRSSLFPLLLVACVACVATLAIEPGALCPREARASVAIAMSLEELARSSSVVARVTTLDRESAWEDGRIVTYSRVRVDDVVAGETPGKARELRVRTLGGRVGSVGQLVEGEPMLAPNESSIVFLVAHPSAAVASVVVMGRAQGQLVIRRDAHGREIVRVGRVGELVDRRLRPPLRPSGRRIVELDGAALETVSLDAKKAWEAGHAR